MVHLNTLKRIAFLSGALLLLSVDALAQSGGMAPPTAAWPRYRVAGEEFSIALPTLPAMTTYAQTREGREPRTQRYLGVYADGVVYTIYCDDTEPQDAVKNSRKRLLPMQGWEPSSEQDVNRDGATGKQFTSSNPLGGVLQVLATKKHFYRIQAFGATVADPRVQHFFSSLMLGKNPDGIEVTDGPGTPFEPVDVQIPADSMSPGNQVDRKVVLLMKTEPTYTEEARQHRTTGAVILKAVFSANGSVVNIQVKSGLPNGLTEQAIEVAKRIKFIPAAKDGKFVSVWTQLEYNFNLF
ncbi:MAG TPA: TonB family protein [Pyrinomonadaceae bacterium]|nr:TonB family protein [Pyrinomonadaceae bacterium]